MAMNDPEREREALALFEALLDIPEDQRAAWITQHTDGRPELAERIAALAAAHTRALLSTGGATDDLDEEPPPDRIGAYRIVERIGHGGMGSVYLGERVTGDFAHQAAIKIIKPGLLSEALVDRFQRERQTLARLRHPNIAQLYDGGETAAGSPFIVMEYVDGLPLLAWVEAEGADRATRQRLFLDICAAVAFANRNLIVHRDLTPSNILITAEGAVKLIDFGIAKPVDGEGRAADPGKPSIHSLSLTPGYAAPERLVSSEVGTAADIYSLGRILEKLLPPAPDDRELRAIIARATAPDPAARYASADALAADVDAWRAHRPVSALPQTRAYHLRKFVRRHRAGVAAAAGMLALLVGALAITLAANHRAQLARADAEQRFGETRAIANMLLFDVYDEVSRVPGSTSARALLAQTGLRYLDALGADDNAPVDVRVETARGYIRLAQVIGGGQHAQLGRFADSNGLLDRAAQIAASLAETHPDAPGVRQMRADLLVEQSGTNLYNNNAIQTARQQAVEAQTLLKDVAASDAETARLYALAIQAEGDTHLWEDEFETARTIHLRGERFIAGLPDALRGTVEVRSVRSSNLRLLGEAYHRLKQADPARAVLDRAVAINRQLAREHPDDPALLRKLVISLRYRAVVHRTNMRDELARASIEEAMRWAQALQSRDRNDTGSLQLYAVVAEVQAQILSDLNRFAESFAAMDRTIAAHHRMVALAGNAAGARRSMAQALRTAGAVRYDGGDYPAACRDWREARALFAGLEEEGALSETDRNTAVPSLAGYLRQACDGGPRAGLGPQV